MSPTTMLYPETNIVFARVRLGSDASAEAAVSAGGTTNVLSEAWIADQGGWRSEAIRFGPITLPADEVAGLLEFWGKLDPAPATEYSPLDLPPFSPRAES